MRFPSCDGIGTGRSPCHTWQVLILFSLSSRRDCRVSPPVTFVTRTRLCGSYPPCIASDAEDGRYPLRRPMKLGLSSHSGWTGRFPSLASVRGHPRRPSQKPISIQRTKKSRYPCLSFIPLTVTRIVPISEGLKLIGIGTKPSCHFATFQAAPWKTRPNSFGDTSQQPVQKPRKL